MRIISIELTILLQITWRCQNAKHKGEFIFYFLSYPFVYFFPLYLYLPLPFFVTFAILTT